MPSAIDQINAYMWSWITLHFWYRLRLWYLSPPLSPSPFPLPLPPHPLPPLAKIHHWLIYTQSGTQPLVGSLYWTIKRANFCHIHEWKCFQRIVIDTQNCARFAGFSVQMLKDHCHVTHSRNYSIVTQFIIFSRTENLRLIRVSFWF